MPFLHIFKLINLPPASSMNEVEVPLKRVAIKIKIQVENQTISKQIHFTLKDFKFYLESWSALILAVFDRQKFDQLFHRIDLHPLFFDKVWYVRCLCSAFLGILFVSFYQFGLDESLKSQFLSRFDWLVASIKVKFEVGGYWLINFYLSTY